MERGPEPLSEEPGLEQTLDVLLDNTEDAYTFPPFGWVSPLLTFDGLHLEALRAKERDLLRTAIHTARRARMRVIGPRVA